MYVDNSVGEKEAAIEELRQQLVMLNMDNSSRVSFSLKQQEAQLMLTTGSTRLAVSRGQQTWYHSTCYI